MLLLFLLLLLLSPQIYLVCSQLSIVGWKLGCCDKLGVDEGNVEGVVVGLLDGDVVGCIEGTVDGDTLGSTDGVADGLEDVVG